jgi:hypothetical protein
MSNKIGLISSSSGVLCLWERGTESESGSTGYSTVICNRDGSPKTALFVNSSRNPLKVLENELEGRTHLHALIPISENDVIIDTVQFDKKFTITISIVKSVNENDQIAEIDEKYVYNPIKKCWNSDIPKCFEEPVKIAKHISLTSDCREASYIRKRRR